MHVAAFAYFELGLMKIQSVQQASVSQTVCMLV